MLYHHLIDATGIVALSLNLSALLRPSDRGLLKTTGWASALWALNSLLIGASTAAALSALGVGRQASAAALQERPGRLKAAAFAALLLATLAVGGLTWSGIESLFPLAGSLVATYAMFQLRGSALRWAMVLVNALWMVNAIVHGAGWQIAANLLCGSAAAVGAWRARRA
jgi:hypothetical protein